MTVTEDGPVVQHATRNDKRVTPIGRMLRRYSIDELPQLPPVVQGNMSLVVRIPPKADTGSGDGGRERDEPTVMLPGCGAISVNVRDLSKECSA